MSSDTTKLAAGTAIIIAILTAVVALVLWGKGDANANTIILILGVLPPTITGVLAMLRADHAATASESASNNVQAIADGLSDKVVEQTSAKNMLIDQIEHGTAETRQAAAQQMKTNGDS